MWYVEAVGVNWDDTADVCSLFKIAPWWHHKVLDLSAVSGQRSELGLDGYIELFA